MYQVSAQYVKVFGVSSFGGKAIRQWAAELYKQVVIVKKASVLPGSESSSEIEKSSMKTENSSKVLKQTYESQPISFDRYRISGEVTENKRDVPVTTPKTSVKFDQTYHSAQKDTGNSNDSSISGRVENDSRVESEPLQINIQSNDQLKHVLKMRLVKGEISKDEYLELLKIIES
jgi:hypothetical protein